MHPAYRWADSYANPMHYQDPRTKEISPHMKMDPYYYHGHGPQECYNHGYFGGPYSFPPPYPYYPPPPPPPSFHHHGFYPPFPGAYSIPPPHYSVEQPRYDYDKNTPHHCCGCNNRKDEKKLRIEREEPEIEKKSRIEREEPKKEPDSLVPFLFKDSPYPIMWVPPGIMNNESKAKDKESSELLEQGGSDGQKLPFPIFWIPSKKNQVGEKNNLVAQTGSDLSKNDDKKIIEAESDAGSKQGVQKVIPVKQVENKIPKSIETKSKPDSVEKRDKGMDGKCSPKTSKLPPVCLRIDPLPKKKKSSRSPSPPGDKRSMDSTLNNSKSCQEKTEISEGLKEEEKNIKTIKVMNAANEVEKDGVSDSCENVQNVEGNGSKKDVVCKVEKKKLSENEAALIIQSVFRGFQVRKSKPIMKLREIAGVGKQVIELRKCIEDLKSCFDGKQKLIIGETIMSLLLKLDTIQGLHPLVRDVRKSVAKELVGLQEKLDSLKCETPIEEESNSKVKTIQEKSEEGEAQLVESELQNIELNKNEVEVESEKDESDSNSGNDMKVVVMENQQPIAAVTDEELYSNSAIDLCENGEDGHTESQDNGEVEPNVELQNGEFNKKDVEVEVEVSLEDEKCQSDNKDNDMKHELKETDQPVIVEEKPGEAEFGTNIQTMEHEEISMKSDMNVEPENQVQMLQQSPDVVNDVTMDVKAEEDLMEKVDDSRVVMEENERLRSAVEELMKAGKEQMGVIKELTGRVKDLEKKLSKKKRIKVNKGRSRGRIVQEE